MPELNPYNLPSQFSRRKLGFGALTAAAVTAALAAGGDKKPETPAHPQPEAPLEYNNPEGHDLGAKLSLSAHAQPDPEKTETRAQPKVTVPASFLNNPGANKPVRENAPAKKELEKKPKEDPISEDYSTVPDFGDAFEPVIETPTDPEAYQPPELINLHPENLTVPENVREIMRGNVVQLSGSHCSGFLIRNQSGEKKAVWTAQHCGLLSDSENLITGADGQVKISYGVPIEAKTGDTLKALKSEGKIDRFIVSGKNSEMSHDVAIGGFEGVSDEEVLANGQFAPAELIENLKPGDVIYMSGFPAFKEGNVPNNERREFALHVLGIETVETKNGQKMRRLIAALPDNEEGASCTPGASGSLGFKHEETNQRKIVIPIGVLSAYYNFESEEGEDPEAGNQRREMIQSWFGVNMEGYSGACAFSIELPPDNDRMIIKVESPENQQGSLLALMERYKEEFFKEDFNRQVLDGIVNVRTPKGSYVIDRPSIFYDAETDATLMGWHEFDENGNETISLQPFVGDEGLIWPLVYSRDGKEPSIIDASGRLIPAEDQSVKSFKNESGLAFGELKWTEEPPSGEPLRIVVDEESGQITFEPYAGKGGDPEAAPPSTK